MTEEALRDAATSHSGVVPTLREFRTMAREVLRLRAKVALLETEAGWRQSPERMGGAQTDDRHEIGG
jgi:hypothetical protein